MIILCWMNFIGVDTSSKRGSVALLFGGKIIDRSESDSGESFSRSLLDMLNRLLAANSAGLNDITGLGVAVGPGSFTGIRIGIATLQGLALSKRLPVYGVSTLEAMARSAVKRDVNLKPMMDARNGDVYYAKFRYEGDRLVRLTADSAGPVESTFEPGDDECLHFGEGAEQYSETIAARTGLYDKEAMSDCVAAGVALAAQYRMAAGDIGDTAAVKPNYIRQGKAARAKPLI